uniref:Piezo non-specific cation channel R-Ras-binding domain-containing protein n=1 Tax=Neogobius melanostomus TaxID=47308 RepID=A0A8C6U0L7_9GOBI
PCFCDFLAKSKARVDKTYPQPRGQKKKKVVKYGMGGMIVALLICIVWFPLLFMSLVKSVAGVVNRPQDVSFTITLAGFQPIFTMSAQQNQLRDVSAAEFLQFGNNYLTNDDAMQWLEGYMPVDLIIAELKGSSNSLWTISPPSRKNLIEMLNSTEDFPITVSWSVQSTLERKNVKHLLLSLAHHGPVRLRGPRHREVRPRVFQRHLSHHNVRGAPQRGPHPQALHRHLSGPRDRRARPGGGHVLEAHLPLPLARDYDQVDARENAMMTAKTRGLLSPCCEPR